MPPSASGKIERIPDFRSKYVTARNIDVWLPENYSPGKKYAVLYMHDGQMLFDATTTWNKQEWGVDETMSRLLKEDKIREAIVVGIWNSGSNRPSDYFPQKPFESLPEAFRDSLLQATNKEDAFFPVPVQSDSYLRFIVEELKPYIDSKYATKTDRDNTFIAGSSMGGLISLYAICEYPEVFGGAACLSTHWTGTFTDKNNPIPNAFMQYLERNLPQPSTHKLYFDYGTETLDALYEPYQLQADAIMRRKGYTSQNWKTVKFTGADHSEKAWQKRLHIPLTFLLGPTRN